MKTTPLKNKIWLGLAFGLVCGTSFRRLFLKYFSPWIPPSLIIAFAFLFLLIGLVLPYIWHAREKKGTIDSYRLKATLEYLLIYALALDLSMFGWHKIEGLQMIVPLGLLDTPFSEFSGESLVWAFFKYSYPFTVFIALLQLATGVLLLFSRTRLLAFILAVPMLVFISLLDFFYQMPIGVLIHGMILLMGVCYLLSQDFYRFKTFILQPIQGLSVLPNVNFFKWVARLSLLAWPLLFYCIYDYPDKHPQLTGKYSVQHLTVNNNHQEAISPKDSVLTKVYLDLDDEVVFDFNDYRYRYIGQYTLDEQTDSIQIKWRYPSDSVAPFIGKLFQEKGQLVLQGKIGEDRLKMILAKQVP